MENEEVWQKRDQEANQGELWLAVGVLLAGWLSIWKSPWTAKTNQMADAILLWCDRKDKGRIGPSPCGSTYEEKQNVA